MKVCILCSSSAPQSVHIRPSGILNFITHFSSQQQGQSFCTKYLPERWKTRFLQYSTWQDWRTIHSCFIRKPKKTSPPSVQVAAMRSKHQQNWKTKLHWNILETPFLLKFSWNTLGTFFEYPWNFLKKSLKLPWKSL